jgi:DNA topoisomerase-1
MRLPEGAFLAELAEWDGKKVEIHNQDEASKVVTPLESAKYVVSKVEQKERQEKAPPPFITSTLQQQASIRLHYSAKRTMMLAQRLYEGVELGTEGAVALITYMRTDSTRVADEALKACREHIGNAYGKAYVPEAPNRFTSGKSAQEAHEAIRPTDLSYTPEQVAKYLPQDQLKLYALIYNRFVASQMKPAVFAVTNIEVAAAQGLFKAQGKILKFDGYRRALPPGGKQEDALLPALKEKQALDLLELSPTQHFTQPPPRYSEASLVKALEKEGIGRPSTYAAIISKIQDRGYVEQKERRFQATELGMVVTDLLVEHFPKVMDLKFTGHMEEEFDLIEGSKVGRDEVLTEFWEPFRQSLEVAKTKMQAVKGIETEEKCPLCQKPLVVRYSKKTGSKFLGCSGYPECTYTKPVDGTREAPVLTEHKCPTCGKPMMQRMGARGPFLGCTGYPDCRTTMNFDSEGKPVLASKPTEHTCEKCGKPMVLRDGPRGTFLACTGYPKCRNAKDVDAEGNPVKPIETGIQCEKCGSPMVVKRGPRGPFLGCSAYPRCRGTMPVPADLKEQIKTLMPQKKKVVPAVDVSETCPECGAQMKLRQGRRGFFLGCAKYPKCKGTREASPELLEQVG